MANPHGNLAGFSDPEEPGWQQRALERVKARQAKRRNSDARKNSITLFIDDGFRVLLDEACRRRNISLSGYCRRAVGAFIAHDLKLKLADVLHFTAVPAGYGEHSGPRPNERSHDDGKGRGAWHIEGITE